MKASKMPSKWFARLAAAALAMGAVASCNGAAPVGVEFSDAVVVTADVVAIDKVGRIVTLIGPEGNKVDIEAGDEVRNFDQIKLGDKVKVTYYESVALYLGIPGSQPEVDATQAVVRAAEGERPGGMVARTIDVSASVRAIDRKKRELTLKLADGDVVKIEVDPSVKAFDTLKVGDSIHARLTRALAIAVEAPWGS